MTIFIRVCFDDAGYGDLGSYGHPTLLTPNFDSVATNGRKFTRYYTASPVCSPSRCASLTGQLQNYYWIRRADTPEAGQRAFLPSGANTLARALRAVGVSCGIFGKWHLGDPGQGRNTQSPSRYGFDRVFITPGGRPSSSWLDLANYWNSYWFDVSGDNPAYTLTQYVGFATDVTFAKAAEWILAETALGKDVYCDIELHAPHEPLASDVPEASNPAYSGGTTAERTYWGTMTNADNGFGALLTALSNADLLDATYILITSDNGPESISADSAGSAGGLRGKKTNLWEGGLRVPCLLQGPGISAGSTDNTPRWALDFLPTVGTIFGADVSAYPGSDMLAASGVRDFFWEYPYTQRTGDPSGAQAMLRGDIKLVRFAEDGSDDRFYDVSTIAGEQDVNELTLVESNPGAGELLQSEADDMSAGLTAWWGDIPKPAAAGYDVLDPATIEEANAIMEQWYTEVPDSYRVHMCGSSGELTAMESALDSLLGLPRTAPCSHGQAGATETTHGAARSSHEFWGTSSVVTEGIIERCTDPAYRANCSAGELAAIDLVLATTAGNRSGA